MTLDGWLRHLEQAHPRAWDLGLERVGAVARTLSVTRPAPAVFVVAGTNGKGSTCEVIDRLCRGAGLTTGKSTSPHLVRFNERISINGQVADDEEIVNAFETIEQARGEISLTYFEFAALASMLIFRDRHVDVAILEVGLGGRLDAMNVVEPDASVITRVALDHQSWLGSDREAIGAEKAGILRAGVPCVLGERSPPASVLSRAEALGAPCYRLGCEFDLDAGGALHLAGADCLEATTFHWPSALPVDNALAALQATVLAGVEVDPQIVAGALADFALPGRFQWLEGPPRALFDVAHNPDAAALLAQRLGEITRGRYHAVFGMYADKDIEQVVALMSPCIDEWYVSEIPGGRAKSAADIKDVIELAGGSVAGKYAKVAHAYEAAVANARDDDVIVVFGSFQIVGGVLEHLNEQP